MKIYNTIQELLDDLNVTKDSISLDFHIYKYNELSHVENEIFEPHRKRFFSINFHVKNVTARRIGYTYFSNLDESINFNSPMQIFSIEGEKSIGREGFGVFFTSDFFKPSMHRFDVIQKFPFFKLNALPYYRLSEKHFLEINTLLEKIYAEHVNNEAYSLEIIHSQLLILLHRIKRMRSDMSEVVKLSRAEEITHNFEDLILKEIQSQRSLSEYAKKLHITSAYLSECVKKVTGQSAKKVVIDYKVLQAKALLKNSTDSISEVAERMGYSETTNFVKFFRKYQGKTPLAYRNS